MNNFFYKGLCDNIKLLVDAFVGGQLSTIRQSQVKGIFENLSKTATWKGEKRVAPTAKFEANIAETIQREL